MAENPPTPTELRLFNEVVAPLLDTVPERMDQDLLESGADSMILVHIFAQAEELFGVELSPVQLMDDVSIASLAALIDRQLVAAAND
jgi:acyl carrier protein